MPADIIPASKSIRRNRAGNVDSERLIARRAFLAGVVANPRSIEKRCEFAHRAIELQAIENVLEARGALPGPRISLA